MKKRVHLKGKKNLKKTNLLLMTIILVFIIVILFLNVINKRFTPILLETAELEINKFSTIVINKAISRLLEDEINTDELFDTVINNNGEIQTIDFNPITVNQILNIITNVVQTNLDSLEQGDLSAVEMSNMNLSEDRIKDLKKGIITKIPIGVITKNTILANLGPSIPIRLHYAGDATSNITTNIKQYGINNALVEIGVKLEMTAQIILPFVTEKITLEFTIPLAIKMIQGNVPNYYGSGLVKDSSLYSLPLE